MSEAHTQKPIKQTKGAIEELTSEIQEYLEWMTSSGHAHGTQLAHTRGLGQFLEFIAQGGYQWDSIFTRDTFEAFNTPSDVTRSAAVIGLFPANSKGDDIEVYAVNGSEKTKPLVTFHFLRNQAAQPTGRYNASLADYILPAESSKRDYIGGFAVTAGVGIEPLIEKYEADHDDYNSIMIKAVADRLAEAFAELMHEKVRKKLWAYATDEAFDNESLINNNNYHILKQNNQ